MEGWQTRWKKLPETRSSKRNSLNCYKWVGGLHANNITADECYEKEAKMVLVWYGSSLWIDDGINGFYDSMDEMDTDVMAALTLKAVSGR